LLLGDFFESLFCVCFFSSSSPTHNPPKKTKKKQSTQVSSVGVVDGGALAASLTPADLRGLVPERFDALAQPVLQFLSQRAADAAAAHAAGGASLAAAAAAAVAAGGDAAEAWDVRGAEGLRAPRPAACVSPSATLADVVRLLAGGERAVYVAGAAAGAGAGDGAGGGGATAPPLPQGVVTATDVLRVVTGFNDGDEGDGGDDAEMEEDEEAYDEEEEEEEDEEEMGGGGGAAAGGDDAADTTPAELVSANRLAGESRGAEKGSAGALNGGGGG
jgi:CBS domain-containing protein